MKSNNRYNGCGQYLKKISIIFPVFLISISCLAQEYQEYHKGFVKKISSASFAYHSPLPNISKAMLIRARTEYKPMIWETESLGEIESNQKISFMWMYAKDVTLSPATFHLSFNGHQILSFKSAQKPTLGEEVIQGPSGIALHFINTMIDKYGDQMGFAVLDVPGHLIRINQPNEIRISAGQENVDTWYMTFEAALEPSATFTQNKVILKGESQNKYSVLAEIIHLGAPTTATITIGDHTHAMPLSSGYNRMEMMVHPVKKETTQQAIIKIGDTREVKSFTLKPVKEMEIYLIQHTHSDIGYTRPQSEILPEHLRYIDHALDYCDETENYPDAAKFRWTCETSWSVKEYLKRRPQEQIDRLLKRIKEGRIEATGMFFNFSEIIDEQAIAYQTKYLRLLEDYGIEVTTAMQNDVNGAAWSLIDVFHNTGVKYLSMGIHGHRARIPFGQPTAFWWESPAENRMLAFRGEHYMHGNFLELTSGNQTIFAKNLSDYLTDLEEKKYPYNAVALQFSGYVTDNAPPSTKVCDIIKKWNEKYAWPKLRSALVKDFMHYLDQEFGNNLLIRKEAWPDWWTDGVGSATNETLQTRKIQSDINVTAALFSMLKLQGKDISPSVLQEIQLIYENLLFYDEHTHGASESVRDPRVLNSINQWNMKSSYAWDALKRNSMLQEEALAFLEASIPRSQQPGLVVYNTLNWQRSALTKIFIGYETIPDGKSYQISTLDNKPVYAEIVEKRVEGAYYEIFVEDLPPMGYKRLLIHLGEDNTQKPKKEESPFENNYYRLTLDTSRGGLVELYDKSLQINIIDPDSKYSLGTVIHEKLKNRHDLERLTAGLRDTIYKPLNQEYESIKNLKITHTGQNSIYKYILLNGQLPRTVDHRGIDIEIRLYHHEKKIDLLYKMIKLPNYDPEGIYVSFPFELKGGNLQFEVQGGIISPGKEQIPGSAADWNTIQNFASVTNNKNQIVFVSNEIPLVQFGDLNIGRYYYRLLPTTNHIYSWVLNNYWVTNFKASQEGELRWSYTLTTSEDISDKFAIRFSRNNRVPAPARLIPASIDLSKQTQVGKSFLNLANDNLLLVQAIPSMDGLGVVLQLREISGFATNLETKNLIPGRQDITLEEVNVLEQKIADINNNLFFGPYKTRFIKLIIP